MKTIEVTDVVIGNIHHVHSVFCEVSRENGFEFYCLGRGEHKPVV